MCIFEFRKSVLIAPPETGCRGPGECRVGQGCGGRSLSGPAQWGEGKHKVQGPPDAHLAHKGHSRCSSNAQGSVTGLCLVGREPEQAGSWRVGGLEDRNHPTGGGKVRRSPELWD